MYITLKSVKRDIGLFNLEIMDLIIGFSFFVLFAIFFISKNYNVGTLIGIIGITCLIPINFSNKNRFYKIIVLLFNYFYRPRNYYYLKDEK